MNKDNWAAVYDENGRHIATRNGRGEMKSLGYSDESPPHVALEIRAAELALGADNTLAEHDGYMAHFDGKDPSDDGWAGWLEREIGTGLTDLERENEERIKDRVKEELGKLPQDPPPPEWQAKVHSECDKIDAAHFDLQAESSLDTIDQSEPAPAPEAQLHDVHSDDETTHVGEAPVVVDALFDQTESES
jgi:hypothetical protein